MSKKRPTPPPKKPAASDPPIDDTPHPAESAPAKPSRRRDPKPATVDASERTLPHNLDAERSVLGAVLVHNDAFELAARSVSSRHFYRDAHRRIFEAMAHLIDERKSVVDFTTLKEEMNRRGELDEVGGPAYIASLADGMPRATNVKYYAGIVREKATLREIIYISNRTLTNAYEADERPELILAEADRALLDLQREGGGSDAVRIGDRAAVHALMERLQYRNDHKGELTGINTGFQSVNELTFGWQRPDMIVVAARPSIGKTGFVLNTSIAACEAGGVVAMFSLEMRRKQIEERLLSTLSGVDLSRIQSGYFSSQDWAPLAHGVERLAALNFFINDRSGQTTWDVRGECRRLKAEHGRLDLVIIDYVQLMPGTLKGRATRYDEVTDISRRVKNDIAGDLDVPVILLSQLNRGASKRNDPRPKLEDLRESGRLEEDADIVAFLHRPNHLASGTTQFIIDKQRNGSGGTVNLTFTRETQTFTDGGEDLPEPEPRRRRGSKKAQPPRLPSMGGPEDPVDEPAAAE